MFNKIIFDKIFAAVIHSISVTLRVFRDIQESFSYMGGQEKLPAPTVNVLSRHDHVRDLH